MSYLLCPDCETASVTWPGLNWHVRGAHLKVLKREEVQEVEEQPEGYRIVGRKKERLPKEMEEVGEIERPVKEAAELPKELPDDFVERSRLSLAANEIPEKLISQIVTKIQWHPEVQENPNAFSNMLTSILGTALTGRKYLGKVGWIVSEVFGPPPAPPAGPPLYSGGAPGAPYYSGWYGGPPTYGYPSGYEPARTSEDPMTRWINYQIARDEKEEGRTKEAKLPPALEARLSEIEQSNQHAAESFNLLLDRLDKQDAKDEESKWEGRFTRLEQKIESKKKGDEGSNWLEAFLKERDKREDEARKRLEDIIRDQNDKLAEATKDIAEAAKRERGAAAEAISDEESRFKRHKDMLKEEGWAPRERKEAEEILAIAKDQLIPGAVGEIRETGKAIRRLAGQPPSAPSEEAPKTPVTPEQAGKMAEAMEHRETIIKLQEGA